jgi:hypothetical protein
LAQQVLDTIKEKQALKKQQEEQINTLIEKWLITKKK